MNQSYADAFQAFFAMLVNVIFAHSLMTAIAIVMVVVSMIDWISWLGQRSASGDDRGDDRPEGIRR